MNYFHKANKTLLTYSLITIITIPIIGIKFFISFLGNILLLLFLIPIFLLVATFVGFNFFKSKINLCGNCGSISFGDSESCIHCGADLENIAQMNRVDKKASETTIEIKAEEIK